MKFELLNAIKLIYEVPKQILLIYMVQLKCPLCGGEVLVEDDALPGEIVEHDCGAQLEIVREDGKMSLRLAEQIGEDWGE